MGAEKGTLNKRAGLLLPILTSHYGNGNGEEGGVRSGTCFYYNNSMITKRFGVDFYSSGGALTLNPENVTDSGADSGTHSRTHESGWTITGEIHEDYYTWVNDFEATHPIYGRVWGNFEQEVYADSEEGFADFHAKHPPEAWDYLDI